MATSCRVPSYRDKTGKKKGEKIKGEMVEKGREEERESNLFNFFSLNFGLFLLLFLF